MSILRRVVSSEGVVRFTKRIFKSLTVAGDPPDLPSSTSSSLIHGIHIFHCPDTVGIVAKLSECIAARGGNILVADVFVSQNRNIFYSRRRLFRHHQAMTTTTTTATDLRQSPDHHTCDLEPPRQFARRQADHDHYDNNCHHRPESSAAARPPPPPRTTSKSTAASTAIHHNHESVFSRISLPEEKSRCGPPKKRKLTSTDTASASRAHKEVKGYHEDYPYHDKEVLTSRRSTNAANNGASVEYETCDEDDRHFKRRRSRRYDSPVEAEEDELVE